MDMEERGDDENQVHQSNFAQTKESIETSPCYFAGQGEIAKIREERYDEI